MEPEESSIERLKRSLYSRDENLVPKEKRTPVGPHETNVPTNWGEAPSFGLTPEAMAKPNNSFFNKFLVGSLIFFFIALGIALFIFFGGANMISSDNLDMSIVAPSSISSGEELLIGLTVLNGNRADLEEVSLIIEYPEGSRDVVSGEALVREKIDLGTIEKGTSKDHALRTVLFGEKDAIKSFNFRIEYRVKGSNAVFSKEKPFEVIIGSSPILLNVTYPSEVNSGQEIEFLIDVTSNSSAVVGNAMVKVEYPYGFTYNLSTPAPIQGNSTWSLGDLTNGDKKTISIKGVLVGQNMEDRSFRVSVGTVEGSSTEFSTTLAATIETIGIRKSFYDLQVTGGNRNISDMGEFVPVSIKWQNTLSDRIVNGRIEAAISGNVFDRTKVIVSNGGLYRSVNNTITWDKNGTPSLVAMSPGAGGEVSFSIGSFAQSVQTRNIKNPHIDIKVTMSGERTGLEGGTVVSTSLTTIKISSLTTLTSRSYRAVGSLSNTGPIPPRADRESTYTIKWVITNTNNDLRNTVVVAKLPPGIVWKNEHTPVSEEITFDPGTRTVTWNAKNVSAGSGFTLSPKEVSFKVGVTPSVTDIGKTMTLVMDAEMSAVDSYTEAELVSRAQLVTTLFSDATIKSGDANVAP